MQINISSSTLPSLNVQDGSEHKVGLSTFTRTEFRILNFDFKNFQPSWKSINVIQWPG
jgi:hypothetical protein